MKSRFLAAALLLQSVAAGSVIGDVRSAIAQRNFALGEAYLEKYRADKGVTPEMLEALSWLGRGALAVRQLEKAEEYAAETHKLALQQLKRRALDAERHLPIALGAAIEVQAQVMAARGHRSVAVDFLRRELASYRTTSIRTRIQKNLHLLSLKDRPAPALETQEWLGPRALPLAELKGRPVLLFFWAHWCGDCKRQAPVLARLKSKYGGKGLLLVGPTQRYGYMSRGQEATPEQELRYIDEVRHLHYRDLLDMPVPVSEENFKNYGASSTPTLVLIDRRGLVQMYHPGEMPYEELAPQVEAVVGK
jgi:thiol-disulfide isomerase/thioredoxin